MCDGIGAAGWVAFPELRDDAGHALAADKLHGVVVNAAVLADRIDRNDIGVIESGRRADLILKSHEPGFVQHRGERQDLQRDPAPHGRLLGLEDDAHSAAADLAHDLKLAERLEDFMGAIARRVVERRIRLADRGQRRKDIPNHLCNFGMTLGKLLDLGLLAARNPFEVFTGKLAQEAVGLCVALLGRVAVRLHRAVSSRSVGPISPRHWKVLQPGRAWIGVAGWPCHNACWLYRQ